MSDTIAYQPWEWEDECRKAQAEVRSLKQQLTDARAENENLRDILQRLCDSSAPYEKLETEWNRAIDDAIVILSASKILCIHCNHPETSHPITLPNNITCKHFTPPGI